MHPSLNASVGVDCPWCGETVELLVDTSGGDSQSYVEDCEVCCNPIELTVAYEDAVLTQFQASSIEQ